MTLRLRTSLSLAFVAVGLAAVLTLMVFVNLFLQVQFRHYAVRKQEERNREVLALVATQYDGNGHFKAGVIQDIGVSVLQEGLILRLVDAQGRTVWDALEYNSGICHAMIDQMAASMSARYPSLQGGLTQMGYPVQYGGRQVGTLQIGTYGPFYYSDTEFLFIDTLNRLLLWVALGAVAVSLASGLLAARRLSNPIARVIASTRQIAAGEYEVRVAARSRTREVRELEEAVNHLARNLGEQDRLRRRLTADVAHELRTPLTTVRGHLEAMIDGVWEPTGERLKGCHEEILRLGHLVQDLATLARFESGALTLRREPVQLAELVEDVVRLHGQRFRMKGVELRSASRPIAVPADREKMVQVLVNLLDNALTFTPPGGTVDVRTDTEGSLACLSVRDTGRGIPEKDLPHVFERFYRVDESRARSSGGSGIGLTIVREIVRAHAGTVQARSTPGEGTEILVRLPLLAPGPSSRTNP
jgi:two-component system sensor histidine kinase BaeS